MSTSENNQKVTVDCQGFIDVDGVRVGRVVGDGRIQLCDKDKRRSSQRGTRYVVVNVTDLANATKSNTPVDK